MRRIIFIHRASYVCLLMLASPRFALALDNEPAQQPGAGFVVGGGGGGGGIRQEYCTMEFFNASCPPGQLVVMQSAIYGRMRLGRCVHLNYGHLGCSVNVRNHLDVRCSGRNFCQILLPDPVLHRLRPCPGDLSSYLEASYTCLEVDTGGPEMCGRRSHIHLPLTKTHGFIGSSPSDDSTDYGSSKCPWELNVQPGQRLNVSILNFLSTESSGAGSDGLSYGPQRTDVCLEVAVVHDLGFNERRPVTVCGGDARQMHVMVSQSHRIRIELSNRKMMRSMGSFIIEYQVIGCADPASVVDGWIRRNGDTVLMGCNTSLVSWHLTCRNGQWHGEIGNCSTQTGAVWRFDQMFSKEESFPYGILLMVVVGVAVGVVVGGLLLCFIVSCTKRFSRSPELNGYSPSEYQGIVVNPATVTNHGAIGQTTTTVYSDWLGGDPAVDDPLPPPPHSPAPSLRATFDGHMGRHDTPMSHHHHHLFHHHHPHQLNHTEDMDTGGGGGGGGGQICSQFSIHTSPKTDKHQLQQQPPRALTAAGVVCGAAMQNGGCYRPSLPLSLSSTPLASFRHQQHLQQLQQQQLQQQQPTQFFCDSQDFV